MVTTQARAVEPHVEIEVREDQTATPAGSDPDTEYRRRSSTPVRGGVTRFRGYTDSDDEEDEVSETDPDEDPEEDDSEADAEPESDPEEDPEEEPEEQEPAGYIDAMGTTADDIIESSTAKIAELEERVQHLEEQNAVHQHVEDQYRDIAHQRHGEVADLLQAQGELVRQLEKQTTRADQMQMERDVA